MVDYGAAVSRGWKYARSAERIAVLTIVLLAAATLVLVPLVSAFKSVTLGSFQTLNVLSSFAWLLAGIIIAGLLYLFFALLFTRNYANQKSVVKSADFAKSRYLRFLAATVLVGIITMAVSAIPIIGFIFAIIVGLLFFFVDQEIAVRDTGAVNALKNSYNTFKRSWTDVIITAIVAAVLSIVVVLIFAIPLLIVGFSAIISVVRGAQILPAISSNLPLFVVTGVILAVGVALAILLSIGIKTDVYMQLKKKRK